MAHPTLKDYTSITGCPDFTDRIHIVADKTVATGGYSSVYMGTADLDGVQTTVAIKVVRTQGHTADPSHIATLKRRVCRESKTWYSFNHANIIKLYGLADHSVFPSGIPGMVSPWCDKGSVLNFLEGNPEAKRVPLIQGVASGLHHIHGHNAVHGDIKSANILMSHDEPLRPLLADFGCSKFLGIKGYTTDLKTSIMYLSPELMNTVGSQNVDENGKKKGGTITTQKSDVWAFALVGAEILGGAEVFRSIRPYQLFSYIAKGGRPKKADFPKISAEADTVWPLLELCWNEDPDVRPTMEGVLLSLS